MSHISPTASRRRGATAYLTASVVQQIAALLRYVLLARLLGPEQLGIAATLILTASFFDLVSDTASDRFLIQDQHGDEPVIQRLVQLVLVGRGGLIALAMIVTAWPVALFYNTPALAGGLMGLALSPFIMGFIHLDMRRAQRDNDFRAEGLSGIASELVGLVATVTAALLTRNFTAVLFGLIARSLTLVVCSHLFAKRPYEVGYSKEHSGRLRRFSMPLMANGLILFLGGQGDRVLVGRRIGFAWLGHYSAVMLLIYYPSAIVQKFAHTIYLPLIAAHRTDPEARARVGDLLGAQTLLLAILMAAGFALVAPFAVNFLYGRAFSLAPPLIALIGILQTSRFLTLWPTTVALAMGRTTIVLANNFIRLLAWPAALVGVAVTRDLYEIVLGFILGEFIAFAVALVMLNNTEKAPITNGFDRFVAYLASAGCVLGWSLLPSHPSVLGFCLLLVLSGGLIVWVWRAERVAIDDAIRVASQIAARGPARIWSSPSRTDGRTRASGVSDE